MNYSIDEFSLYPYKHFALDKGRIIIVTDLAEGVNPFYIVTSNQTYTNTIPLLDLTSDDDYASVLNNSFKVLFNNSIISSVYFNGHDNVEAFSYSADDYSFEINSTGYSSSNLFARYTQNNNYFESDSYVFANNRKVRTLITPTVDNEIINITLNFRMPIAYTNYFVNNFYYGAIERNTSACEKFEWNYLDLYNRTTGVTFLFNKSTSMRLCYTNTTINLNVTLPLTQMNFEIIPHVGTYTHTVNYTTFVSARYGMKQTFRGISLARGRMFNDSDYDTLKMAWGYNKEFNVFLRNETNHNLMIYKNRKPDLTEDAFVKTTECQILTDNATKQRCRLLIQTW
jgi:hypothetical protein